MEGYADKFLPQLNNERMCVELGSELYNEIAVLKATLNKVDKDNTKSVDIINKHTRIVIDALQIFIDKKLDTEKYLSQYPNPIHHILSVGRLRRTEIPQDVVKKMIIAGFSVNDYYHSWYGTTDTKIKYGTCLYNAINFKHFSTARLLIDHNASCRYRYNEEISIEEPAIVLLASHTSAPFDLLDLFATGSAPDILSKALSVALFVFNIQTALHLTKLGASVDRADEGRLSIDEFVGMYVWRISSSKCCAELFVRLLPPRAKGEKISRLIVEVLGKTHRQDSAVVLYLLQQLIQRLTFLQPISVYIDPESWNNAIQINDEKTGTVIRNNVQFYQALNLLTLLLITLQIDIESIPDDIVPSLLDLYLDSTEECMAYAHAVDDLWRTFRQTCKVKSLLRLCILRVRNSMSSLDDNSFQTLRLHVPPYVHRMVTYRDVAEGIHEEWCKGINKSS